MQHGWIIHDCLERWSSSSYRKEDNGCLVLPLELDLFLLDRQRYVQNEVKVHQRPQMRKNVPKMNIVGIIRIDSIVINKYNISYFHNKGQYLQGLIKVIPYSNNHAVISFAAIAMHNE